nr:MAG TPA: hypothetical protein [Caudoviricetes sp.]
MKPSNPSGFDKIKSIVFDMFYLLDETLFF